uniref:Uncharacterized protein n=1 Tax=Walleye epidermal hyperplasia virus 2 TaxID=64461 RepID=Q9WHJ0_9RETR|nr:unknown [Walleye epidermal hyperplasia virus 2]
MAWNKKHNWHRSHQQSEPVFTDHLTQITTIIPHFPLTEIVHLQDWNTDLIKLIRNQLCRIKQHNEVPCIWIHGPNIIHKNTWIKVTPRFCELLTTIEPFTHKWCRNKFKAYKRTTYLKGLTVEWFITGQTGNTF